MGKSPVLAGGTSNEREISLCGGKGVFESLQRQRIDVILVDVTDDMIDPSSGTQIDSLSEFRIEGLSGTRIDRVFNTIHGRGGQDGTLQAALEALNIPHTGSGVLASALSMDKLQTKMCWREKGLPTPSWFVLRSEDDIDECIKQLELPVIVKPSEEGSSIGISKATDREELLKAFRECRQYDCTIYVEQWIQGQEYTVGILGDQILPIIHVETFGDLYNFDSKYFSNTTQYHCPCGLSLSQQEHLNDLCMRACKCLGVEGCVRLDLFVDNNNLLQLIEINTVPGMTDRSLIPVAAKAAGIDFDRLVWMILGMSTKVVKGTKEL